MSGGHEKAPRSWQANAGQADLRCIAGDNNHGQSFTTQRQAALALLNGQYRLTRKAGQFLGQLVVDPAPMTPAQADWLAKLLTKHDLPNLVAEGVI